MSERLPGIATGRRGPMAAQIRYEYVRQLEDAVLVLWGELPTAEVLTLREDAPALVEFVRHLHHSIEHEQAMVRMNYWAAVDRG